MSDTVNNEKTKAALSEARIGSVLEMVTSEWDGPYTTGWFVVKQTGIADSKGNPTGILLNPISFNGPDEIIFVNDSFASAEKLITRFIDARELAEILRTQNNRSCANAWKEILFNCDL